jgi:hypothetical protein
MPCINTPQQGQEDNPGRPPPRMKNHRRYHMTLEWPQLRIVSDIAKDIAQVFFASVFLEPLVTGNSSFYTFMLGISLAFVSWLFSIVLVKSK